jgi:hypothetical protein
MVEKVAKIRVPTAGFHGGKQVHGLHHMEARFLMFTGGEKNICKK